MAAQQAAQQSAEPQSGGTPYERALARAQEIDRQRGTVSGTAGAQVNRNPLLDILPAPSAAARESVKNGFALTPPKNSIGYRSSGERNFSGGGASLEDGTRSYTAPKEEKSFGRKMLDFVGGLGEAFQLGGQQTLSAIDQADYWLGVKLGLIDPKDEYTKQQAFALQNDIAEGVGELTDGKPKWQQMLTEGFQSAGNIFGSTMNLYATGLPNVAGQAVAPAAAKLAGAEAGLGATAAQKAAAGATRFAGNLLGSAAANMSGTNAAISVQSGVNKYSEAKNAGASDDAAFTAAIGAAAAEYFSNKLFSGTPLEDAPGEKGYVVKLIETVSKWLGKDKALQRVLGSTAGKVGSTVFDKVGEGLEEVVTGFLDPFIDRLTFDEDKDLATAEELLDEFLGGVVMSLIVSAPGAARSGVNAISRANAENRTGRALGAEGADTLVNIGLSMDGEAKALAEKLNAKQKSGKALTNREVGQLYRAISMSVDGESVGASVNPTVSSARESGVSESTAAMARRISEITGRNIVFYSAAAENRGGRTYTENGYYDGEGTLHINAQSANPTAQIIAHELTHALEGTEGYQAFRDAVLNRMAQSGQDVAQLRQQTAELYQRAGRPASDVDSELVAQYVEKSLLTDEAAIRDICVSQPTAARRILNWLDGILAKMGNQKAQERAAEREFLETARSFYRRGLAEVNAAGNVNGQTSAENVNIPGQESAPAAESATNERAESANERTARDAGVVQNTAERTSAENARQETERVYQEKIKQLENVTTMEEATHLIAELNELERLRAADKEQALRQEYGKVSDAFGTPENHIDNRDWTDVGKRNVMAFQFDHPRLHPYFVEAAKAMQQQLSDTQRGERFPVKGLSEYLPSTVGFTGVKRQTSDSIAYLLDSGRFSYESIGKALDDIIHNNGQENYAAAKRVELVLDDMLTNGYADVDGRPHGPNEAYIAEKSKIPGAEVTEAAPEVDSDYSADLVEDGYDAAQEQARQRTAQETQQATQETEAERRKRESYKDVPGLRWKSVPEARVDELLRTGLAELDGQQGVGNDGEVADAWKYSISEIVDENGKSYGIGVYLDSVLLENLTEEERVQMVKERVKELGGQHFTAFDNNGNEVDIQIAEPQDRFVNKSGKSIPVNKDLTTKNRNSRIKQESVVLADELITTARHSKDSAARYSHGWLDNNGKNDWAQWKTYVQDKENTIWEATLHVATTANGEKILYDIDPIRKVGQSGNSDTSPLSTGQSGNSDTSTVTRSIFNSSENVNSKFSVSEDSQGRELSEAQQEYFKDSKAVDEEGRLLNIDGFYLNVEKKPVNLEPTEKNMEAYNAGVHFRETYGENTEAAWTRFFFDEPELAEKTVFYNSVNERYFNAGMRGELPQYRLAIRFGKIPENGRSKNWGTGELERGVSVVNFLNSKTQNEKTLYDYVYGMQGTEKTIVGGWDFGIYGTDGEPLLINPVTIAPASEINRIKLADNQNPTGDPDIRYSRKETAQNVTTSERDILNELVKKYGAIPKGERASRDVELPRQTGESEKVSRTVRTVMEAKATPDEALPSIEKLAAKGKFSYEVYSDKQAISDAAAQIEEVGWSSALEKWTKAVKSGNVSKANTAMGWALYNNAVNKGDTDLAIDVLEKMVEHQRSAAQAVQATRILKQMTPETQLYGVQRSVANLQAELNDRYVGKKRNAPELKIDPSLAEQLVKAKDQTARDAALRDIYRDIGRQMPSRFRDRWNAWRYLAMLGNARTHGRNVVGNLGFVLPVAIKDAAATGIEAAVYRLSGGRMERSKAFGKDFGKLAKAAWSDYAKVQETALGGGKYSDMQNANKYVEEGRKIFGNLQTNSPYAAVRTAARTWNNTVGKALESFRKFNGKALDAEDVWFSKPHYAFAMAQFCKANGITAEQIRNGERLEAARDYAILEAQKATYRDTNEFSQMVSQLGRSGTGSKNRFVRGASTVMEGILPFRKTPANILARGVEYSPIGLLNGIYKATAGVAKGKYTAAQAIDSISAGLTGSGLMAFGMFLAAQGLVRGRGGDDDEKRKFEEMQGHQAYSLELPDGTSVTLDWLAPEALPFFVGVNLWEATHEKKAVEDGKSALTSGLALSLEFKMAAEILKTVLVRDLTELIVLGAVIALRALLSVLIHFEMKQGH